MATKTASASPKTASSAPAYRAYTVVKREGKNTKPDYWLNIGAAFAHEDGAGFNLLLQALPVDGKLVLRTYKEADKTQSNK